jgi:hypothetical protein
MWREDSAAARAFSVATGHPFNGNVVRQKDGGHVDSWPPSFCFAVI